MDTKDPFYVPKEFREGLAKIAVDAYNRHWYYRLGKPKAVVDRFLRMKKKRENNG
jgi:hypothetical protein